MGLVVIKLNTQASKRLPEHSKAQPEAVKDSIEAAGRKRERGKSSNPEFIKLTSYVRRETRQAVKRRLLDDEGEISELIEELLSQWLSSSGAVKKLLKKKD